MTEEWRPVTGYENIYEISSFGRVRSIDRTSPQGARLVGRLLRASAQESGHTSVTLSKNGKTKTVNVHKLVAQSFLGPCPFGLEILHADGVPANNKASNLHYGTRAQNLIDAYEHGALASGMDNHLTLHSAERIAYVRSLKDAVSSRTASLLSGLSPRHIRDIWAGKKRRRD